MSHGNSNPAPRVSQWPGVDLNLRSIRDSFSKWIPHKDVPYTQIVSEPDEEAASLDSRQERDKLNPEVGIHAPVDHDDQPPSFHSVGGAPGTRGDPSNNGVKWEKDLNRWKHIKDLDDFFKKIYVFWVEGGYLPLVVGLYLDLLQFVFIFLLIIFLITCVDYSKLVSPSNSENKADPLDFIDFRPLLNPPASVIILLLFGIPFWIWRTFRAIHKSIIFLDIRDFYRSALGLDTSKIRNYPWTLVVDRLKSFQQQGDGYVLLIKKRDMSSLDVYHRILRFQNFMVAMMNRRLLPMHFHLPLLGKMVFCPSMLLKNYTWILFSAPGSLFQPKYHLVDEVRSSFSKDLIVKKLSNRVAYFALLNLLFFPFVLLYQFFFSIFSYADLARKNPNAMGLRLWSIPAKLEFLHFNELDHEMQQRLSRAYTPSKNYLQLYSNPIVNLFARHCGFISGALLALILFFGFLNENVFFTEYLIKVGSILGIIVAVCRVLVPPEDMLQEEPKFLLAEVLKQVHYMPEDWKLHPEDQGVMKEFSQLFQFRVILILHELFSPLLTPFILYFSFRRKSSDIIDFFRQFTVEVEGLGDVCSFAQLDLQRHGDMDWISAQESRDSGGMQSGANILEASTSALAKNGKTELSLLSFSVRNPTWKPPRQSSELLKMVREESSTGNDHGMYLSTLSDPTHTLPISDLPSIARFPSLRMTSSSYQETQASQQIIALHRMHESQSSFKPTSSMFFGNWNLPFQPPQSPPASLFADSKPEILPSAKKVVCPEIGQLTEPLIGPLDNKVFQPPTELPPEQTK